MLCRTLGIFALSSAALLACGGSQPAPTPPPPSGEGTPAADAGAATTAPAASGTPSATAPAGRPAMAFDSFSADKKVEVMTTKVSPSVGKVFKEHDAAKWGKWGCKSCHGGSTKNDPRTILPKLTFSNGGYDKLTKSQPDMMKFMTDKVLPTMATAMGEKAADPQSTTGFACNVCHTIE